MIVNERDNNKLIPAFLRSYGTFIGLLVLVFFCLSLVGIVNHEMWLDELQAWLIARDSSSVIDLFKNLKYEGHPGLWHICLYLISRFTYSPISMQLFHLMIATGVIYVFIKFSPFTRLQKVLFAFGYFPFYEYSIISRNYALGVLFIFLFCALFKTTSKSYIFLACILGLLANTNIYGLIVAIVLGLALILECILFQDNIKLFRSRKWDLIISGLIALFGILISIIQIIPPPDASFSPGWTTDLQIERLAKVIVTIGKSYVPLPNFFKYQFWNSSLLTIGTIVGGLSTVFSLGILTFAIVIFLQKPVVFFMYITGTLGMLSFMYLKYIGSLRHCGHLFIWFITCLWISSYYVKSHLIIDFIESIFPRFSRAINKLNTLFSKYKKKVIMAILCTHVVAGIYAFTMDFYYPFSLTKEVARFIDNQRMKDIVVVGDIDYINYLGPPLSAHFGKKIYYLGGHSSGLGSFLVWDKSRGYIRTQNSFQFFDRIDKYLTTKDEDKDTLLVLNHKVEDCKNRNPDSQLENLDSEIEGSGDYCWSSTTYFVSQISEFNNGLISDENPGIYLYLIKSPKKR
jgi:hypothetical protein